jgi:WD40 repeat protein
MHGHENVIEAVVWLLPAAVETVLACVEFEGQFPAAASGAGPQPQMLLSGSRDKTIRLWDASTGNCLKVYVRLPLDLHFYGLLGCLRLILSD